MKKLKKKVFFSKFGFSENLQQMVNAGNGAIFGFHTIKFTNEELLLIATLFLLSPNSTSQIPQKDLVNIRSWQVNMTPFFNRVRNSV